MYPADDSDESDSSSDAETLSSGSILSNISNYSNSKKKKRQYKKRKINNSTAGEISGRFGGEGGRIVIFIRDDIPSRMLRKHVFPDDIESSFIELNFRKAKWLLFWNISPTNSK